MKKFFEKAKMEIKFKKAGDGHTLAGESTSKPQPQTSQPQTSQARHPPSEGAQKAGMAALERFSQNDKKGKRPHSATATWKHGQSGGQEPKGAQAHTDAAINFNEMRRQVKEELVLEKEVHAQTKVEMPKDVEMEAAPVLSVSGVYFICPLCPTSLTKPEIDTHMEQCLYKELTLEQEVTVCTMIHSLNKDKGKVKSCIDILCRYLDNICKNPDDEKFRSIKQNNKVFKDKVAGIKGVPEFFQVCGFSETQSTIDDSEEPFYVLTDPSTEKIEKLVLMKEILLSAQPIKPKLDRSLRVLQPSSSDIKFELPNDFFAMTAEEVKKEQNSREEEVERNKQLRTRAMRENDKNPSRTYKFTLMRVRFPGGIILQATFHVHEHIKALFELVRENLVSEWQPFVLTETGSKQLVEEEATFRQLGLVPATVVNFSWDPIILADIVAAGAGVENQTFLKPEILLRLEK